MGLGFGVLVTNPCTIRIVSSFVMGVLEDCLYVQSRKLAFSAFVNELSTVL